GQETAAGRRRPGGPAPGQGRDRHESGGGTDEPRYPTARSRPPDEPRGPTGRRRPPGGTQDGPSPGGHAAPWTVAEEPSSRRAVGSVSRRAVDRRIRRAALRARPEPPGPGAGRGPAPRTAPSAASGAAAPAGDGDRRPARREERDRAARDVRRRRVTAGLGQVG